MTIQEFYNNPMGKGAAASNIKSIREGYNKKYEAYVKKISHRTYFINKDIYVAFKIPSSVDKIFYDVVIKFTPNEKSAGVSVDDMDYKFFSNSPSFLFTYANVYYRKGMMIKELNKKLSKEALKKASDTRNPYGIISYDITIYSALKYMIENGWTRLNALRQGDVVYSSTTNTLAKYIQDFDTLQKNRGIQKGENKRLEEKAKEEQEAMQKIKYTDKTTPVIENKTVKSVKLTKKIKSAKVKNKVVSKIKKAKKKK